VSEALSGRYARADRNSRGAAGVGAAAVGLSPLADHTQHTWHALRPGSCLLVPAGGIVLDVPCGTGRYFPMIAAAGLAVAGADQSAGMLEQARARGFATMLEQVSLQELGYDHAFDAAITVDAMENVPPEDWPVVVAGLRRAVRPGGAL
jgi:SAM-dependent methyltransferase